MIGWTKVKDTRLARKMYPEHREHEEIGYILIPEVINISKKSSAARVEIAKQLLNYNIIDRRGFLRLIYNIK